MLVSKLVGKSVEVEWLMVGELFTGLLVGGQWSCVTSFKLFVN